MNGVTFFMFLFMYIHDMCNLYIDFYGLYTHVYVCIFDWEIGRTEDVFSQTSV